MGQKIQKKSRFFWYPINDKKTLKIVPKLSCQLDRNNDLMELGIYMNKTSFLSMLPHVVSLGLPTAPSAHWKARSSSKSGYIYETRLNKFRLDLATIGKNTTLGFKTSILPSYFSAKSFFLFGIVSQRVGAHCYTGTMGWHHFWSIYSQVPNKRVGPNKLAGWLFWANFIDE